MEADRRRTVVGLVAVAVFAAVITGLVVWVVMNGAVTEAEEKVARAEERVEALESEVQSLTAALAVSADEDADAIDPDDDAEADDEARDDDASPEEADASSAEDGRFFCFMSSARWEGSNPELTVDYAQLLTGDAAADAATAAGDESPPPNDYYIVNENPRLRTFPADPTMTVRMTSTSEGTRPEGYDVPFGEWFDAYSGMSGYFPAIRSVPYWITVEDGTITLIEEQYLP